MLHFNKIHIPRVQQFKWTFYKNELIVSIILFVYVWGNIQGLLTEQIPILPRGLSKLDELVLLGTGLFMILVLLLRHRFPCHFDDVVILLLLATTVLSSVVNHVDMVRWTVSVVSYFQYYTIYWLIKKIRIEKDDLPKLYKAWIVIVLINVPVSLVQYLNYGTIVSGDNPEWDSVRGIFFTGCANVMAYFCGFFLLYAGTKYLHGKLKKVDLVTAFFVTIPFFLSSGKSAYLFIVPAFIMANITIFFKNIRKSGFFLGCGFLLFVFISSVLYGKGIGGQLSIRTRIEENMTTSSKNMGRVLFFILSQEIINEKWWGNLIGVGPGTFSSYAARTLGSEYLDYVVETTNAESSLIPSSLIAIRTETGYLGYGLYVLLVLSTVISMRKYSRQVRNNHWIFSTQYSFALYFIFASLPENSWETPVTSLSFWFISGVFYHVVKNPPASASISNQGLQV